MRSACVLSALVAIAAAAPAPSPQLIDLAAIEAAPDPVLVSAPLDVLSDIPHKKRDVIGKMKRDGNCATQPPGSGPVSTPDTVEAFQSNGDLQAMATNAPTPDGYSKAFSNLDGSLSASKYMGLHTLKSFDTLGCASLCDQANDCEAFNMYIERDPSVDPNAQNCPNPASTTNYKCTLWGAPVSGDEATNKGQWRDSFHVVITGSNGYNKASPPDPIDGFNGPTELGGAINAPLDNGANTYLGYKYFPFSQSQGYTPSTCADACKAQTGYNSRHPKADGSYQTCSFFNAYVLSQNAIPQGLYCSLYSKTWAPSYATNRGQYRGSDRKPFLGNSRTATPIAEQVKRASTPNASIPRADAPNIANATWICPICSYSNPIPSNFDAASASVHTPLPPCLACGIKPPLAHILKAAIATASGRSSTDFAHSRPSLQSEDAEPASEIRNSHDSRARNPQPPSLAPRFQCPRCTFQNHPSLLECEICGASLISAEDPNYQTFSQTQPRPESPGPSLDGQPDQFAKDPECIRFSFRAGGEKIFYERLKGAMTQRKWLLRNAPPIPKPDLSPPTTPDLGLDNHIAQLSRDSRTKVVGIAGLERRGAELRKNNATVIGGAFEDLEALMASAKEVVALAEEFSRQSADKDSASEALLKESATALGMVTTRDMLGLNTASQSLYLSELSRNLAEYLTDDAKGILRKEGGVMSLVDLWAVFNRSRGGIELVSPADFEKAARLWAELGLPVRLREFKNGLLVVQRFDWTDDRIISLLSVWLQELQLIPPDEEIGWDWRRFGKGVTAQEAAAHFGWSIGVASEELEMAEDKGVLCREEGVEGIKYWKNWILHANDDFTEQLDVLSLEQDAPNFK
ncbi:MAG: hypothetical protein Q9222_002663 [Ikaeria aurantiellina]